MENKTLPEGNKTTRAALAISLMATELSEQQAKTLTGLVKSGDVGGAFIGLGRILRRTK